MPYDDDLARGHHVTHFDIPDEPVNVVPVSADKANAITELISRFPNLGYSAVLSEIRRNLPDVTVDEVRTVMVGQD